jgi:hypothetical protein
MGHARPLHRGRHASVVRRKKCAICTPEPWSDLLGCHVGVRADVLRGMPVGIPAWQAKRLLHGALDKVHHLRRRPLTDLLELHLQHGDVLLFLGGQLRAQLGFESRRNLTRQLLEMVSRAALHFERGLV